MLAFSLFNFQLEVSVPWQIAILLSLDQLSTFYAFNFQYGEISWRVPLFVKFFASIPSSWKFHALVTSTFFIYFDKMALTD